ncbi:hypothetical protein BCR34DRAFT_13667 [Clohesyomyces aquaticus]|uniref:Symplekin/Pta1 N-terminal domain-containing protein n=1 Tax=Clohesyomyces aquaticus TaxID=1231657 RepID=A0A1Y1ZDC2_9PLEO|nr:hypothetical protein BCR34DRAFT_13667 [Clohesyomyces aquaticus]
MNPLGQLESARSLALGDGRYYPTIIPGVLPIIGPNANASLDTRRWGADFLAETFASPTWPSDAKEPSCLTVLPTLRAYLDDNDTGVIKSAVQAAASIYPLVYRHTISSHDSPNWQHMLAIKSNILRRMDTAPPGVRVCCVKFVQQVVLVQTPGQIADPRVRSPRLPPPAGNDLSSVQRPEQNDISLALVPRDHNLLSHSQLEAEASGLLDRLLDIVHGDHSDALLVTATLNALGMLIPRRPTIASKIIGSILNFNALKLANSPMTPKNKVIMKSMERTTRALLVNVMKRNPDNPFNTRIHQYLERMHHTRVDVFDESKRKRPAPVEQADGMDPSKRQRVVPIVPITQNVPPLPPGPVSYRELFTLDPNGGPAFDVQAFQDPEQLLSILVPVLQSIDATKLGDAINAVRARYLALQKAPPQPAPGVSAPLNDEEEEYEPDFEPEDNEQIVNQLDSAPPEDMIPDRVTNAPLVPYKLPQAPPLTKEEVQKYGDGTIRRVFGMLSSLEEPSSRSKAPKRGFNRLAASSYDRDSWVTILARLATRASAGLDDPDENTKSESGNGEKGNFAISESIRNALHNYVMYDWKKRIDIGISWLNEEWYNDRVQSNIMNKGSKFAANGNGSSPSVYKGNYRRCALRLLNAIIAFAEGTDKVLLRFMSEIPELDREILMRMKKMAEDPERIDLAIMVLQYLYMFRPPVREICVDVLVDMWQTNERAKPAASKILKRWKPEVLSQGNAVKMETANGSLEVKAI